MLQRMRRTTRRARALIHDVRFGTFFRSYDTRRVSARAGSWPSDCGYATLAGAGRASCRAHGSVSFAGWAGPGLRDCYRSLAQRRFVGLLFRRLGPTTWAGSPRRWAFGGDVTDH